MSAEYQGRVYRGRTAYGRDAVRMEAAGWTVVRVAVETSIPGCRPTLQSFAWWLTRKPNERYFVTYHREPPQLPSAPPTGDRPRG